MKIERYKPLAVLNEGRRNKMYRDSEDIETIGIGHNLRDKPISDRAVDLIFEDDFNEVLAELDKYIDWWRELDEVRQCALIDMAFQMGVGGVLGFHNTLGLIRSGRYAEAAFAMKESKWHRQTPVRCERVALMMETGVMPL